MATPKREDSAPRRARGRDRVLANAEAHDELPDDGAGIVLFDLDAMPPLPAL